MNVLVLDIDGVLNGHEKDEDGYCKIEPRCIAPLNRIIREAGCVFLLSSAWRYMLLNTPEFSPSMTPLGFDYMMRSHGVKRFKLVGHTDSDEDFGYPQIQDNAMRSWQVFRWLNQHRDEVERAVVVDDNDFGFSASTLPFIQTPATEGLTDWHADLVINAFKSDVSLIARILRNENNKRAGQSLSPVRKRI